MVEKPVTIFDKFSVCKCCIPEIIENLKRQGYLKEPNLMYKSLVETIAENVDNKKLTDKVFREFIKDSLKVIGKAKLFEPKQRVLLKDMFERMEEMLTDDILERYIPGETTDRTAAIKMWETDVETYVSLCKKFHFAVNEEAILKTGRRRNEDSA